MSLRHLMGGAAIVAFASVCAVEAQAQVTSGDIRGQVTDSSGAPVSGASVQIIDTRTNTVTQAATDAQGAFNARSLRPGGPYQVVVMASGFATQQVDDVSIGLGDTVRLPVRLNPQSTETIVVTASATGVSDLATGPSSTFTLDDIEGFSSISRDPRDFARLDPFANINESNEGAIQFAGMHNRTNSFTVDGVAQNDLFGLNASGFPAQNKGPISVDAIEQLSVNIAPFDVEYGGFTGGNVNVVTKSGRNDFFGSLAYYYTDDGLKGDKVGDDDLTFDFEEKTWSATLGGPIIRDRLFFFVAYDDFDRAEPVDEGPAGSGVVNEVDGITLAETEEIRQILIDTYGFDPGSYNDVANESQDEKLLVKFDANITDSIRASYTYQTSEGNSIEERRGSGDLGSPSTWYNRSEELESHSFQLFADWTDNFSTEFKVAYSEQITGQDSLNGADFAAFNIDVASGDTYSVGPDIFRHANALSNEAWQYKVKGDYIWNDHLFTVGYERFDQDVFNLFVPTSEGEYDFDSIADLAARQASDFSYTNAISNDENDGAASFGYAINTLYAQDEWSFSDNLTVTAGLRYDYYESGDAPRFNENFVDRHGFANNETLDGRDILLPRLGFNWTPEFDGFLSDITVRGGVGRFAGGSPLVWISNSYSNDGVATDSTDSDELGAGVLSNVDGFNIPQAAQDALVAGDGSTNSIDPDFEIPSVWRASIGVDKYFDIPALNSDDWRVSFDFVYGVNDAAPFLTDLNCFDPIDEAPDGRPIYSCNASQQDYHLTNTDKGHQTVWSVSFDKDFENGFDLFGSYTHQDVTDAWPGESTTASSGYSDWASFNRNAAVLTSTSNYEIEHTFKLAVGWRHEFIDNYATRVQLYAERASGQPFSYTFDGNGGSYSIFGIPESAADDGGALFYVPAADADGNVTLASDPLVTYAPGFDIDAFNEFLHASGLIGSEGSIAPRNGFRSRWTTRVDLRLQQEIPFFGPSRFLPDWFEGNEKAIFFMDIENLGNLLDSDAGRVETINQFGDELFQEVLAPDLVGGVFEYDAFPQSDESRITFDSSVWQVQFGVKYQF